MQSVDLEKYCGAPSYTDIPACLQIGGEKMKRILAFLLVLTVALGLGACVGPEEASPQAGGEGAAAAAEYPYAPVPIYNAQNEKIGELEQSGSVYPTEGGFVYTKRVDDRIGLDISGGVIDIEYYLYTVSSGEHIKIGAVQNHYMQSKGVLLQNHLFFFEVIYTEEESVVKLLDLDLENHTMSEVYSEVDGSYFQSMAGVGESLFFAKPVENGACIQEYNISEKEMKTLMRLSWDAASDEREMLRSLWADENTISLLMLETDTGRSKEPAHLRVDVYDRDMKFLGSRYISGVTDEEGQNQFAMNFIYSSGFLYYQNASFTSFLGRVTDKGVERLLEDDSARMAYETAQIPETKLLYRSYDEGNTLYLVDVKTGDIREGSFSADDELYQIKDVSRDTGGNVWIRMGYEDPSTDERPERLYYVSESDLHFS